MGWNVRLLTLGVGESGSGDLSGWGGGARGKVGWYCSAFGWRREPRSRTVDEGEGFS